MVDFITEIFKNYGIVGLLCCIIVGLLYYLIKNILDKKNELLETTLSSGFDKMTEGFNTMNSNYQKQNEILIDALSNTVKTVIESHDESKRVSHSESMAKRMNVSGKINDELYDMMVTYRARRAMVFEFHNSKENLNGLPFVWYDCIYESTQPNVEKILQKCKDIPISQTMSIIKDLTNHDGYLVYNRENIMNLKSKNGMIYIWLLENNVNIENIVYIGLYNSDNLMIGVITLEYTNDKYLIENALIDKLDILKRVERISTYLEFD